MKAYLVNVKYDSDQGDAVVFANTVKEAKNKIHSTDLEYDTWIDVQAKRSPEFDGMENHSDKELAKEMWREGWNYFDYNHVPDCETATDEEFYQWYDGIYI